MLRRGHGRIAVVRLRSGCSGQQAGCSRRVPASGEEAVLGVRHPDLEVPRPDRSSSAAPALLLADPWRWLVAGRGDPATVDRAPLPARPADAEVWVCSSILVTGVRLIDIASASTSGRLRFPRRATEGGSAAISTGLSRPGPVPGPTVGWIWPGYWRTRRPGDGSRRDVGTSKIGAPSPAGVEDRDQCARRGLRRAPRCPPGASAHVLPANQYRRSNRAARLVAGLVDWLATAASAPDDADRGRQVRRRRNRARSGEQARPAAAQRRADIVEADAASRPRQAR